MGRHLHRLSEIDEENRTATCALCGVVKIWAKHDRPEQRWICAKAHAARVRKGKLKKVYGLSPQQFETMVIAQNGECAGGCGRPCTHVDHNHITGKVRGLLCHKCNVSIGMADEDSNRLQTLADYVRKFE